MKRSITMTYQQIRELSLHDAIVVSWELNKTRRSLTIIISTAFACSEEYGSQGTLTIEYDSLKVERWEDDKVGIPVTDFDEYSLGEFLHEEYGDRKLVLSGHNERTDDWIDWEFSWIDKPSVKYTPREFRESDVVAVFPKEKLTGVRNGELGAIICLLGNGIFEVESVDKNGVSSWTHPLSTGEICLRKPADGPNV